MLKKLLYRFRWFVYCKANKLACPKCMYRTNNNKLMEDHWFNCHMDIPSNREQRRKMAKDAGQIKDWKSLND